MSSDGAIPAYSESRLMIARLSRWIDGGSSEFPLDFADLPAEKQFLVRILLKEVLAVIEDPMISRVSFGDYPQTLMKDPETRLSPLGGRLNRWLLRFVVMHLGGGPLDRETVRF